LPPGDPSSPATGADRGLVRVDRCGYRSAMAIYLFFDESGDLNFSPNGSSYYFFGALTTRNPELLSNPLSRLQYDLLAEGVELERFHASEDRQAVRDRVFEVITSVGGFEFDVVVIEKRKTHPSLHDEVRFYPKFANYLLRYVFQRYAEVGEPIVVVTDTLPVKRTKRAVAKAFKEYIARNLRDRPYALVHHASASHACLQVADYCTWAVHKKWQSNDRRSYDLIKSFLRSEFDIFASGGEYFY